jgi:hypothetical protein
MRRLLFPFSCGAARWVIVGARHAVREQPPAAADDAAVMSLAGRTHVVSEQFDAALQRAGVKVRRVDHVLARPAAGLNRIAGDY